MYENCLSPRNANGTNVLCSANIKVLNTRACSTMQHNHQSTQKFNVISPLTTHVLWKERSCVKNKHVASRNWLLVNRWQDSVKLREKAWIRNDLFNRKPTLTWLVLRANKISTRGLLLNTKTRPFAAKFSCQSTMSFRFANAKRPRIDSHFALPIWDNQGRRRKVSSCAVRTISLSTMTMYKNISNSIGSLVNNSDSPGSILVRAI